MVGVVQSIVGRISEPFRLFHQIARQHRNKSWIEPRVQDATDVTRLGGGCLVLPDLALAQAASPFLTGATALQTNILAWLTPVAIILVMVLGAMAMANRISWGWCIAAILGIAISFGSTQIVTWVRGMFGV